MHSTGKTVAFFTSMNRPRRYSAMGANCSGRSATSVESKWFGTTSASNSNQKIESLVRTSPL